MDKKNIKAFLLYVFSAMVLTWPLLPNIATHYPSTFFYEGGDPNLYLSFMSMAADKVADFGSDPGQRLFYPNGMNLWAGFEAPIILLVSIPIILLTSNVFLAYNSVLLLAFVLTAYLCYLLIRYLTNSYYAALVTGFSFGFSPYMMVRGVQHLDLLLLFTVPWAVLRAFKFIEKPDKHNIIILGLSVFVTAISAWYYLVGAFILLGILFFFNWSKFISSKKQYFYAAGAVAIAILIPAVPIFINRSDRAFRYVSILVETRGADFLNFFIPHPYMFLPSWGIYKYFISPYEATSYFGLIGLIAFLFIVFTWKKFTIPNKGFWIVTFVVFTLIAMGNRANFLGYEVLLPFSFLNDFLPFNRLRAPNRFFIFAYLSATVVFGYFLVYLQTKLQKKHLILASAIVVILLCAERVIFPYPIMKVEVPEFYHELGRNSEEFAVVDIPIINPGYSLYNYYQLYHKKAIVDGEYFWTAYNEHTFDFIISNELLFNSAPCDRLSLSKSIDKEQALKQLSDNNVRYVIVHNLILVNNECKFMTNFIKSFFKDQKPIYADGDISVYETKINN